VTIRALIVPGGEGTAASDLNSSAGWGRDAQNAQRIVSMTLVLAGAGQAPELRNGSAGVFRAEDR
jgi:hypothetical protein